jgi:hypothetical protein
VFGNKCVQVGESSMMHDYTACLYCAHVYLFVSLCYIILHVAVVVYIMLCAVKLCLFKLLFIYYCPFVHIYE